MKKVAAERSMERLAESASRHRDTFREAAVSVTTVCVVEPLTAVRELMVKYVNGLESFRVVYAAADFREADEACRTLKPALVILDGLMWSETGVSLARTIRTGSPDTKVLIFSSSANPEIMRDAVDAGVQGFVLRSESIAALHQAIGALMRGEQRYCGDVVHLLRPNGHLSSGAAARTTLSVRERQVLKEIAQGRLTKEIADSLGMSVFGVQNVRRRIARKTGLRSIAELTLHAAKLRLVEMPAHT